MVYNSHTNHIVFDLDGTLLDTSKRHYTVYQTLIKLLHGKPISQKNYWRLKRSRAPVWEILSASAIANFQDQIVVSRYNKLFLSEIERKKYLTMDTLYPRTFNVLSQLTVGHTLSLVTLRRNKSYVLSQLDSLGIARLFHRIVVLGTYKDPIRAKKRAISMCLNSDRGIVVGDTEADIISGKSLGCVTIALTCGIRSLKLLKSYQPDFLYSGIHQLPRKPSDYFSPRLRKTHTI